MQYSRALAAVAVTAMAHTSDGYSYIGCYNDNGTRDLQKGPRRSGYSIDTCTATCEAQGYAYAALQYYGYCFCDDDYSTPPETYYQLEDSACGDDLLGRGWSNAVFSIASTVDIDAVADDIAETFQMHSAISFDRGSTAQNRGRESSKRPTRLMLVELSSPEALSETQENDAANDLCGLYQESGAVDEYDAVVCKTTTTDPDADETTIERRLLSTTYYIEMYGVDHTYQIDGDTVHKCLDTVCFSNTLDNRRKFVRNDSVSDDVLANGVTADEFSGTTTDGSWSIVDEKIAFAWTDAGELSFSASCSCD